MGDVNFGSVTAADPVPEIPESSQGEICSSPSSIDVEDTPDDIIVHEIRDGIRSSKLSELLYENIINISDPSAIKPFSSTALSEKLNPISLPPAGRFFDHAIGPFREYKGDNKRSYFRLQVEKSPRPDGEVYSVESHVANYVHRCMDLVLSLSPTWFRGAIREGSMDVTIWGCFIDYLFLAIEDVHIVRKEIWLLGTFQNPDRARDCDRFDGILRYSNGITSFDLAIHESSIEPSNIMNDAKGQNDSIKLAKGLAHILRTLAKIVHYKWDIMSQLEVVGFVTSGWNLTCYRMSFLSPKVFKLQNDRTRRLDIDVGRLESPFDIMENMAQEKLVIENTLRVLTKFLKSS